jgi:hypothetical protein
MEVQLMEFEYTGTNAQDIEQQLNEFMNHYDVENTEIVDAGDKILAFLFYEP